MIARACWALAAITWLYAAFCGPWNRGAYERAALLGGVLIGAGSAAKRREADKSSGTVRS